MTTNALLGQEPASEIARMKKFCGALSHDLNNYVGAIQGYVELLKMDLEDNEDPTPSLERILEACKRVRDRTMMLENFAENQRLTGVPCQLSPLLSRVLGQFEGRQIRFSPPAEPLVALADLEILEKAFHQLLLNATEASPSSTVEIQAQREGEDLKVLIVDDGPGVDSAILARIFDPYVTTKGKGRGFGLAWVNGWIGRMGGKLQIVSSPGQGCRVEVFLKAANS